MKMDLGDGVYIDTTVQRLILAELEKKAGSDDLPDDVMLRVVRQIPILNRSIILAERHNAEINSDSDVDVFDNNNNCISCGHHRLSTSERYLKFQEYILGLIDLFGTTLLDIETHGYNRLHNIMRHLFHVYDKNHAYHNGADNPDDPLDFDNAHDFYNLGYSEQEATVEDYVMFINLIHNALRAPVELSAGEPCEKTERETNSNLNLAHHHQLPPDYKK